MATPKLTHETIHSNYGDLAVTNAGIGEPALLLMHGNSTSSKVWKHLFASSVSQKTTVLAFDLPGHGESSNAPKPEDAYTQPGFAQAAVEVLRHYAVKSVVVLGWSLGGHIGIEMIPLCEAAAIDYRGLMIVGTPPIPRGQVAVGFYNDSHMNAAFRDDLGNEEKDAFAHGTAGEPYEDWMKDDVYRTHSCFRRIMFKAMHEGHQSDQQAALELEGKPMVAVVNGKDEPYIRLDFVRSVKYKNLWRNKCIELEGLRHAPFWEDPNQFQTIMEDFLKDCGVA